MAILPILPTDPQPSSRSEDWLPLTVVPGGTAARLRQSDLHTCDRDLLTALGLIPDCCLKVCKTGSPCIVEVRGVRVGLSEAIASRLLVEPVVEPAAEPVPELSGEE